MLLDLSRCTLLFVETRAHEITHRVIKDCLSKATFGEVLIFTDQPAMFNDLCARVIPCEDFPDKKRAGAFYYSQAMESVTTDFALMLEWDAGIHDPSKWLPEFFNYDYIGAPWRMRADDPHNVGNGGFTLMSKRLGQRLCMDRRLHPVYTDMDVCRPARSRLEHEGFTWAPANLGEKFSWELMPRDPDNFGFHGAFNWPTMLLKEEVITRSKLMLKSPYLTVKLREVYRTAPWIVGEFTPDELSVFTEAVTPSILKPRFPGIMTPQQQASLRLMQNHRRRGVVMPRPNQGLKA